MHFDRLLLLAVILPAAQVTADWRDEVVVATQSLSVDMSAQGAQSASLQLIYEGSDSKGRAHRGSSPFKLYVVGKDAKDPLARALGVYRFSDQGWQQDVLQPLDASVNLLQLVDANAAPQLLAYADDAVSTLDLLSQTFQPIRGLPSIYRARAVELDTEIEFAKDLTGDNVEDLLVPDFAGWRFSAATGDGSFAEPQLFGPKPLMNVGSARYVNFTAHTPYTFDHNQDGLLDVAFWNDGALQVYYQGKGAVFSTAPVRLNVAPDIESDAFFSLSVGTDEDNPTGRQVLLDAIEDLDGDGLAEMVVYSVTGDGLFGKETRYEIHRGVLDANNHLAFEANASSVIGSGGIQIDVERRDLNGDGTLEMMVTSFDLGIGSIIRGLLSRTANLQLAIYEMQDGRYPETPVLTRKVTAKLDISSGDIFVPAVLAADINGDGLKDLLVQDGDSELKVFPGQNGKSLFARTPITLEVELPEGEGYVQVADLDGDTRDDLLVVFHADKEKKLPPRIHAVRFVQRE